MSDGKHTRILLSQAASRHLSATGERAFVVVSRGSYPDSAGRWVMHLLPCDVTAANAAVRVALGQSAERRKRQNPS